MDQRQDWPAKTKPKAGPTSRQAPKLKRQISLSRSLALKLIEGHREKETHFFSSGFEAGPALVSASVCQLGLNQSTGVWLAQFRNVRQAGQAASAQLRFVPNLTAAAPVQSAVPMTSEPRARTGRRQWLGLIVRVSLSIVGSVSLCAACQLEIESPNCLCVCPVV